MNKPRGGREREQGGEKGQNKIKKREKRETAETKNVNYRE